MSRKVGQRVWGIGVILGGMRAVGWALGDDMEIAASLAPLG